MLVTKHFYEYKNFNINNIKKILCKRKKVDGGITNHTIIYFFNKEENEDIKKKFTGAYPSNFVNCFIKFSCYKCLNISTHLRQHRN